MNRLPNSAVLVVGGSARPRDRAAARVRLTQVRRMRHAHSIGRVVVVLCILAALVLAAYKPARHTRSGAATGIVTRTV
jgi:hypothetical protein